MIALQPALQEIVTSSDLEALAVAAGTCISAVEPLTQPGQTEIHLKNVIRALHKQLSDRGNNARQIDDMARPIHDLILAPKTSAIWAHALVVMRSADLFRCYLLNGNFKPSLQIEERFQVRPLLGTLAREQRFHLLALSKHRVRLFNCTHHRIEEVPSGGRFPENMDTWLNHRQPDHLLENRSSAGPSVGSMKGAPFGTSSDKDRDRKYLADFFKAIDSGVNSILHDAATPLVLAGVEYEIAIYQRGNTYRRLLEKAVTGSPDGAPDRTLHERAMDVIMQTPSEGLEKTLAHFQKQRPASRVSTDAGEIIKASFQGRVSDLLVSESAEHWGAWNQPKQEIERNGKREDLFNAAALETVRQGGRAFILDPSAMPVQADIAAALRF